MTDVTAPRLAPPEHVAIVGCGFTGATALYQLVTAHPVRRVTVFETSGEFGPGYPYRPDDCSDYLLNNTTDTLCIVPSNRRAFVEWVRRHPVHGKDLDEKGHLPRTAFGAFLKDVVATARTVADVKGIAIEMVAQEVVGLTETEGSVILRCADGVWIADAAILATGRCPDADFVPPPPRGAGVRYIPSHIRTNAFDGVPADATVHVLGASLSAYDVVNRLFSSQTGCGFVETSDGLRFEGGGNTRHVVLCSRSGRPKAVQSRYPMTLERHEFGRKALMGQADRHGGLDLQAVARAIGADAARAGVPLNDNALTEPYAGCAGAAATNARAISLIEEALAAAIDPVGRNVLVDLLSDAQTDIWDAFVAGVLTPEAEARYRAHVESALLSYVAPCPAPTAARLLALMRAGRVRVLRGVRAPRLSEDGLAYEIDHADGTERAAILVNTTGSTDRDPLSPRQAPLFQSMAAAGLLCRHARGDVPLPGAAVDMHSFRIQGARRTYLANMLLWGPGFFTSSAFTMACIVEKLLKNLFEEDVVDSGVL